MRPTFESVPATRDLLPTLAQFGGESGAGPGLLIVGILFITAWLLMRSRKRAKHGPAHTTAREQLERYKQHDGVKNDLESLMVDIEQLAKRLGAQLDAKAQRLEKLIDDADLRIAQLQRAMHQENTPPPETPTPPEVTPNAPLAATRSGALLPAGGDPLTADVYRLADAGLPATDIARQLREHIGKVELILALRQQ